MQLTQRRQQIGQYLGIKPISHGQLFVCEMTAAITADPDKVAIAKTSLARHGSNLGTVAVVRDGDSYRVVLGQEWLEAAQQLGVERLWVHVLDSSDDISTIQQEMTALATPTPNFTLQPKAQPSATKPRTIDELIKSRL